MLNTSNVAATNSTSLSGCQREIEALRSSDAWPKVLLELRDRLGDHRDTEAMTHKDLYVTEAIRSAVVPSERYPSVAVVFKGGTALAKLSILRRFSEDVDVNIIPPPDEVFGSARRKHIRRELHARLDAGIPFPIQHERRGDSFAISRLRYHPGGSDSNIEGRSATYGEVLVEMTIRGQLPGMCSNQPITSLAGEAAARIDPEMLEQYPILKPFEVLAVDPLVSVVDKFDALHWRASSDDPEQVKRRTRDLYDLAVLLQHETVQPRLNPEIVQTIHTTVQDSTPSGLAHQINERPAGGFADSPAFQVGHPACETLRERYPRLRDLVYSADDWISFDDALAVVHAARDLI